MTAVAGSPSTRHDAARAVAHGLPAHGADALGTDAPDRLAGLRQFHTLDALRGVAAVSIVLYHAGFVYGIAPPAEGQLAVDLFFVMSGFIVAYRYGDDLRRGMSVVHFVKLRLIRLYPLFLLGTLLGVLPAIVAVAAGWHDSFHVGLIESLPLAVFMLPSRFALPRIEELYPLNYVAWSLALEMLVNVGYAATHRFWTIRRLAALVAVSFLGLCVCAVVFGRLKGGYAWPHVPVGIVRVLYGFGAGALLCGLHRRQPFVIRVPWWSLIAFAGVLFFARPPGVWAVWELVAIAVGMPAIVAAAVASEPPPALRPACAIAGVYSYAVYSLHAPLVGLFLRGESRAHLDTATQTHTEAFAFTVLLVTLCVGAHLCYDKPVRRYLSARLRAGVSAKPSCPETAEVQAKS